MKIEEIVPPVELCKKIPAGEFEDSAFVRVGNGSIIALRRSAKVAFREETVFYPAPTVAEIMEKLPKCILKHKNNTFFFDCKFKNGAYSGGYIPAEIALQVWLKLKGIE